MIRSAVSPPRSNVLVTAFRTALALAALALLTGSVQGQESPSGGDAMFDAVRRRVDENPERADNWRLLGRLHRKRGETDAALNAFRQALVRDPKSAATHFDLAETFTASERSDQAAFHYAETVALAPESSYAAQVPAKYRAEAEPPPSSAIDEEAAPAIDPNDAVTPATWEIQTFDGEADFERDLVRQGIDPADPSDPPRRLRAFVEAGATWDSNVTLTPISRELSNSDAAAFKGFLNPEVEWFAASTDVWRAGPLLRGYFSVNEGNYSQFDLASFQPGAFVERDGDWLGRDVATRLDYVYSLDLLGGDRFGDRHALTLSATGLRDDGDVVYAYATASATEFADDGTDPTSDSLDGPAVNLGVSRFFRAGYDRMPTWTLGADGALVQTDGSDFRYAGATIRGGVTFQLTERLQFVPDASLGFRDYFDDQSSPKRQDLVGRLGGRLRYRLYESLSISAVVNWNRFASNDDAFDAERLEAGVVTTFIY